MIFGIGTDIVQISRIHQATENTHSRFQNKILSIKERIIYQERSILSHDKGVRYLATRYASKEAFSKAMGIGFREPMAWHAIEILNDELGCPQIILHGALHLWALERKLKARISLSDEKEYALAFVILEQHNHHD